MSPPSRNQSKVEIGYGGRNTSYGDFYADEWQTELRGSRGLRKFKEMRDSDATVGAIMYATEQTLRDVKCKVVAADESAKAEEYKKFLEEVLDDMEHSLDDHISEALSHLTFGFSLHEVVYKIRGGPDFLDKKRYSKFTDGKFGIRKIATRAQWTIQKFDVDPVTGDLLGVWQECSRNGRDTYIPASKLLHYRTVTVNNDPAGRSVLRNAYKSYTYLTKLQAIEAIAVERELHGVPVGRMPAEYLSATATDDQKAIRASFEQAVRDLKLNEQGYIILPSDPYFDDQGKPSNLPLMDIKLIASEGSRNIDIDPIIQRYQHDIARSVMAEFMMLGSKSNGSYALSKSKTDLFLRSMESYINSIYDVLTKQLVEPLWLLNGFDIALMPKLQAGDVAPHDLEALGAYLRNLNGADINLSNQPEIINALLETAELPLLDEALYEESQQQAKDQAMAEIEAKKQPPMAPGAKPAAKPTGKPNG